MLVMTWLLIIIIISLLFVFLVLPRLRNSIEFTSSAPLLPYQRKRFFFSRSEQQFFHSLQAQLDHTRFAIFPKVRLGDFVEVNMPKGDRQQYWNRIKAKHVDFLIYDYKSGKIVLAIELDGASHNTRSAQKNDNFKDELYPVIGITLKRVRVGTNFEEEVRNIVTGL